jgi:uncharacterized NAD(P)/FAD-binding protein YdhS
MSNNNYSITTIAIIGGGFSGTIVATNLLQRATTPVKIKLIEPNSLLGRGLAYGTYSPYHLLNVPAGQISAFPDDPNHFLQWVQRFEDANETFATSKVKENTFVPRQIYGAYVQTILEQAKTAAPDYVRLEHITDKAIAIEPLTKGAIVRLDSGQAFQADQIVLALGNFPPNDPPVQERSFYNSKHYQRSPYSACALSELDSLDPVLLIGSGLTMIDSALTLFRQGHQGKIHVVSRHGLLPLTHKETDPIPAFVSIDSAPKTTRALMHFVRQQVQSAAANNQDWQAVVNSLRPATQSLWQALAVSEQQRFLRHVRHYWDIHRHLIPQEAAEVVGGLISKGQLIVYAGRISAYHQDSSGVDVTLRLRHAKDDILLRVRRVVNCTGPASNYSKLPYRLVQSLLSQGLLCPDALAIGIKTAANGALLDSTGMASKLLYTLGPPRKGDLWETMTVLEIRSQAVALSQELLPQPTSARQTPP